MSDHQGHNKEDLQKLLNFIKELLKFKGNEWFGEELGKTVAAMYSNSDLYNNAILSNLSEHISKSVLKKQAIAFYATARISNKTKEECIHDFIDMEYARRNDDFESFTLRIYQQLEAITGEWFANSKNIIRLRSILTLPVFKKISSEPENIERWGFSAGRLVINLKNRSGEYMAIDEIVQLMNSPNYKYKLKFKHKMFSIIYLEVFKTILYRQEDFDRDKEIVNSIYLVRNLSHRPKKLAFYQNQKEEVDKILREKHFNYLSFYSLLLKIVSSLSK